MKAYLGKFSHLFILLFVMAISCDSAAQMIHPDYLDGVLYVKVKNKTVPQLVPYDSSIVALNQAIDDYGISEILKPFSGIGDEILDHTYKFIFQDIDKVELLIQQLSAFPFVDYAERAPLITTSSTPDDLHEKQWYLPQINAVNAWGLTQGKDHIIIAIVDNAVLIDHEDLLENLWVNPDETENNMDSDLNGYVDDVYGFDVADNNNDPRPPLLFEGSYFSHGTHVAGIAAATTNNSRGIASIGYHTSIVSVKCAKDSSDGNILTHAYEGVKYAIDVNADIISMSWVSKGISATGSALLDAANAKGIVMFAAAGNENSTEALYPASHRHVIGIGATDKYDKKASFSNFGNSVVAMAPGVGIWSTLADSVSDYGYFSGTSMACPLAAGLGALVLAKYPFFTPLQVREIIESNCDDIDELNPDYAGQLGAGRINAAKTLGENTPVPDRVYFSGQVKVYPNPSRGDVFIQIPATSAALPEIIIYDLQGAEVFGKHRLLPSGKDQWQISGAGLNPGIYLLKILTGEGIYHGRIVVTEKNMPK